MGSKWQEVINLANFSVKPKIGMEQKSEDENIGDSL